MANEKQTAQDAINLHQQQLLEMKNDFAFVGGAQGYNHIHLYHCFAPSINTTQKISQYQTELELSAGREAVLESEMVSGYTLRFQSPRNTISFQHLRQEKLQQQIKQHADFTQRQKILAQVRIISFHVV